MNERYITELFVWSNQVTRVSEVQMVVERIKIKIGIETRFPQKQCCQRNSYL